MTAAPVFPSAYPWPFRLGTSSYILPADLLPNVEYLGPLVDDVELVLFESDEVCNFPDPATVERLRALADEHALTYTVHFPLDLDLGHPDGTVRRRSLDLARRVRDTVAPLAPFAYLLHLAGPGEADRTAWLERLSASLDALLAAGFSPAQLCVETLAYPFFWLAPLLDRYPLAVCLDIGHILMGGYDLIGYLATYMPRCRVVHLHGILEGKDHRDLTGLRCGDLQVILEAASTPSPGGRVVTLEVFSQRDFLSSLEVLQAHAPVAGDR